MQIALSITKSLHQDASVIAALNADATSALAQFTDEFADGCADDSDSFDTSSASLSRAGMPLGADLRPRAPPNDDTTKRVYCATPALAAGVVLTEDAALLLGSSKINSK